MHLHMRSGSMKKIIKPFWSFNIIKIENWLEKMESRGFNLYKVNSLGTKFYFIDSYDSVNRFLLSIL